MFILWVLFFHLSLFGLSVCWLEDEQKLTDLVLILIKRQMFSYLVINDQVNQVSVRVADPNKDSGSSRSKNVSFDVGSAA